MENAHRVDHSEIKSFGAFYCQLNFIVSMISHDLNVSFPFGSSYSEQLRFFLEIPQEIMSINMS
jgi:hypothetical protein